jgi:hypothetical protein
MDIPNDPNAFRAALDDKLDPANVRAQSMTKGTPGRRS